MKKIWLFIKKLFIGEKAIVEPGWVYPAKNCFCHMHPFVWCPVHDGGEKPER